MQHIARLVLLMVTNRLIPEGITSLQWKQLLVMAYFLMKANASLAYAYVRGVDIYPIPLNYQGKLLRSGWIGYNIDKVILR